MIDDKLSKVRAEIERRIGVINNRENKIPADKVTLVQLTELLSFIDSMQKEPTSVWHDAIEVPEIDRTILLVAINGNSSLALWDGKSLRSCTLGGGHSVFCKNDKWCYIDDLIKL